MDIRRINFQRKHSCVCVYVCTLVCLINTIATHAFRWSAPGGRVHASASRTRGRRYFKAPAVAASSAERSVSGSQKRADLGDPGPAAGRLGLGLDPGW